MRELNRVWAYLLTYKSDTCCVNVGFTRAALNGPMSRAFSVARIRASSAQGAMRVTM